MILTKEQIARLYEEFTATDYEDNNVVRIEEKDDKNVKYIEAQELKFETLEEIKDKKISIDEYGDGVD